MDFLPITDDLDNASLTIDDLDLAIDDIEFAQSGVGATKTGVETSTPARVAEIVGTSGGTSSRPSSC